MAPKVPIRADFGENDWCQHWCRMGAIIASVLQVMFF